MIKRQAETLLLDLAKGYPILAITGPRQAGKTTLAQSTFPNKRYVSLEDLDEREFADQDPRGFLARFPDGAILDEAQRCPNLFSYLQTRVDAEKRMGLFVLTGSQQFGLMSNITQTLAGRVGLIQLLPFSLQELQAANTPFLSLDNVLWRGMYPPIYDPRKVVCQLCNDLYRARCAAGRGSTEPEFIPTLYQDVCCSCRAAYQYVQPGDRLRGVA